MLDSKTRSEFMENSPARLHRREPDVTDEPAGGMNGCAPGVEVVLVGRVGGRHGGPVERRLAGDWAARASCFAACARSINGGGGGGCNMSSRAGLPSFFRTPFSLSPGSLVPAEGTRSHSRRSSGKTSLGLQKIPSVLRPRMASPDWPRAYQSCR